MRYPDPGDQYIRYVLTIPCIVAPWGRVWQLSSDVAKAAKRKSEGGIGTAEEFWEWSETQVKPFC
jgi:hypothetical protein